MEKKCCRSFFILDAGGGRIVSRWIIKTLLWFAIFLVVSTGAVFNQRDFFRLFRRNSDLKNTCICIYICDETKFSGEFSPAKLKKSAKKKKKQPRGRLITASSHGGAIIKKSRRNETKSLGSKSVLKIEQRKNEGHGRIEDQIQTADTSIRVIFPQVNQQHPADFVVLSNSKTDRTPLSPWFQDYRCSCL